MTGGARGLRYGAASLLAVLLLVAAVLIGVRALGSGQTVDPAHTGYPTAAPVAQPKLYGALLDAPIVVDGRLRVYAAKRQVYADLPVDAKATLSPFWSYRRWPQQLLGVVAGPGPVVVTKWSDGELVGLDGRTGRVAWRARSTVAAGDSGYQGRRTGAESVYQPPDLYTAGSVVISVGTGRADAFDLGTGRRLWSRPLSGQPSCRRTFTGTGVLVAVDRCGDADRVTVLAAGTGAPVNWALSGSVLAEVAPVGCLTGDSNCGGLWDNQQGWLIGAAGGLTPIARPRPATDGAAGQSVPADASGQTGAGATGTAGAAGTAGGVTGRAAANATPPGELGGTSVRLAGTTLLAEAADGAVRAFDAGTGVQRWSWPAVGTTDPGTRIVAVDAGHLSLLTDSGDLIAVDLRTGAQTSRYGLHTDGAVWTAGWVYAAAGYLFMERLQPGVPPSTSDTGYYFPSPDVLFGGTGLS